jgi:hypothetical protein
MSTDSQTDDKGRDPELWAIAQRRVSFKYHLVTYIIINGFLWIVWAMSGNKTDYNGLPWPVWPTLGWGFGLFFHFLGAYVFPKQNAVEKEYEKLKQLKNK